MSIIESKRSLRETGRGKKKQQHRVARIDLENGGIISESCYSRQISSPPEELKTRYNYWEAEQAPDGGLMFYNNSIEKSDREDHLLIAPNKKKAKD